VALGAEGRIVLDAAPDYPIRAVVSFVSPQAQFTPKTVETAEERHKPDLFGSSLQLNKERLAARTSRSSKSAFRAWATFDSNGNAEWPQKPSGEAGFPSSFGILLSRPSFQLAETAMAESAASIEANERAGVWIGR